MKKTLSIIFVTVVCISLLAACSGAYKGLDTSKGLDIYAWETNGSVYFGLTSGAEPSLSDEEISALEPIEAEKMKKIITSYDITTDNLFLYNKTELSNAEVCEMLGLLGE